MKIQMSLLLFMLAAAVVPNSASGLKGAKGKAVPEESLEIPSNRLRALKKGSSGGNSSSRGSVASGGLIEINPCVPWSSVHEAQKTNPQTDNSCASNPPQNGGCCRNYHWLLWDSDNKYPYVPCICNAITQDPNNFVPDTLSP
ncbi:expressed unknown protein [Seminavis robusta]|uniref:Uncharacterized protein n=1 Tax=Seminavis robusta TaxID=568900 RepID=A0A9N8HJQ8_9STRA|nr:expressed unknown protein [Seminavis robusta]|eukprot:Sro782_g201740.1 n/a (143) ;mRNA; f:25653-26081